MDTSKHTPEQVNEAQALAVLVLQWLSKEDPAVKRAVDRVVRAVNSHGQLVAALKQLRIEADLAGFDGRSGFGWPAALQNADAALAAAGAA